MSKIFKENDFKVAKGEDDFTNSIIEEEESIIYILYIIKDKF